MTRSVVSLSPDMTLAQAAERLAEHGISGAPVVDGSGRVVGLLSESDVLRHLSDISEEDLGGLRRAHPMRPLVLLSALGEKSRGKWAGVYRRLRQSRVVDAMTKEVVTARPTDDLERVAALMLDKDINRVPVLEGDRLVGIVSRADFTRLVAKGAEKAPRL